MGLDKIMFIEQLKSRYEEGLAVALRAEEDAREAARSIATESEKKEDGRAVLEFGSLATGQAGRAKTIKAELDQLVGFAKTQIPRFGPKTPIALGAIVDLATDEEEGAEERTFILLPVGAGTELEGPGGDGFISVITPASPIGRGLLGRVAGEGVDVAVRGEWRSWSIVHVS